MSRAYATNGLNQYTAAGTAAFTYDANGNLTGDGTNSYSYDVENRLVGRSGGVTLRYDPLGRLYRVTGPSSDTIFLYDGDALTAEYASNGAVLRRYVHGSNAGADDPLIWYDGATLDPVRYLHADERGSIVAVSDANGNALARNSYDEYGIPAATNLGRFQYTGQIWLPELGMYHYKARAYSPTLGRMMQTDPVGYDDQVNLYAYVANDPVNSSDPSGNVRCSSSGENKMQDCEVVHQAAEEARAIAQRGAADLRNLARAVSSNTELDADQTSLLGAVGRKFGSRSASTLNNVAGRLERIAEGIGERGSGMQIRFGGRREGAFASARIGGNSMIIRPEFFETPGSRSIVILHEAGHGPGGLRDIPLPDNAPGQLGAFAQGARRAYGAPAANWLGANRPEDAARNNDNYVCLVHKACGD